MIRTFFACACVVLLALVACSKQSLGQACSRNFNDSDCEDGLTCKQPDKNKPEGFCCPSSTLGAPSQCQDVPQTVSDAGSDGAVVTDSGSDASDGKADTGTDASDAGDAGDAADADAGI